eukprot:gene5824-6065_t
MAEKGEKSSNTVTEAELCALHTAYYHASTCAIKDDVNALAANWVRYVTTGEDGQAAAVGAGVIATCLAALDNAQAPAAERSLAAGVLLTLCKADDKYKEVLAKTKVGQSSCCQILHNCLEPVDATPKYVLALLTCLAGNAACLTMLVKALSGGVPWHCYCRLLYASNKEPAAAVQREQPALEATAAGLLPVLLDCAARHKSATVVAAVAECLQALCQASASTRDAIGKITGKLKHQQQ